jgi:predicted nucleotidyltransferase
VTGHDAELLKAFREAVLAKIRRDLAEEDRHAASLRESMLPRLKKVIRLARKRGACRRAWLFGSFAWGKPTDRSDVNLLAEDCPDPFRLASTAAKVCDRDFLVVDLKDAPDTLRERVLADGMPL